MTRWESDTEFLELDVRGSTVVERKGRLGTTGVESTLSFEQPWEVSEVVKSMVEGKLAEGFHAIHDANRGLVDSPKIRVNEELEEAIAEDPADERRWLVWADWLQQEGDPRGEYIALRAKKLHVEAGSFLAAHSAELWGKAEYVTKEPFAGATWIGGWEGARPAPIEATVSWDPGRMGFVDRVVVDGLDEQGLVATALARLVASPMGRFTRSLELTIGEVFFGASGQPTLGQVAALLALAKPHALRRLAVGAGGWQLSWTSSGDLGPLLDSTPRLEELRLKLGQIDLGGSLHLPRLRTLVIETGGLAAKNVTAIADAEWRELEELVLFFGTPDYGGDATLADVKAILGHSFPKLSSLALCNCEFQGEVVRETLGSPLLKQVTSLDFSKGTLTDDEARILLERANDLAHVRHLDVSENYLSPELEERLRSAFGARVKTDEQRYQELLRDREHHAPGGVYPDWARTQFRYTAVGE